MRTLVFIHKQTGQKMDMLDLDELVTRKLNVPCDEESFDDATLAIAQVFQRAFNDVESERNLSSDELFPFVLSDEQIWPQLDAFYKAHAGNDALLGVISGIVLEYDVSWEGMTSLFELLGQALSSEDIQRLLN